jgi:hypothetical protein
MCGETRGGPIAQEGTAIQQSVGQALLRG